MPAAMELQHKSLLDEAARRYHGADAFAQRFARGKLRHDPMFSALLRRGCLPDRGALLDLGCGQGLLLALLVAARDQFGRGQWPPGWPPPPLNLTLQGIEIDPDRAGVAQRSLAEWARVTQQDVRDAAFPRCSIVVLLDVLMYLEERDQVRVLEKAAAALEPGGMLLLREADAGAGFAFRVTRWSERVLEILRGRLRDRLHYRGAAQWTGLLETLGFSVSAEPMSAGTPFANVLFVARKNQDNPNETADKRR
jgi:SAM-dependent methyltransferase